jgi:hypothetical protein
MSSESYILSQVRQWLTFVTKSLGEGNSTRSIISSAVVAFVCFFYVYTVGTFLHLGIYPLYNRITPQSFFNFYVINRNIDHSIVAFGIVFWLALNTTGKTRLFAPATYGGLTVIAIIAKLDSLLTIMSLMAIPVIISFLSYNKVTSASKKNSKNPDNPDNLLINYIAIIGIVIGVTGTIISLAPILFIPPNSKLLSLNYMYQVFLFFSIFTPVMIFLLIMCYPIKLLIGSLADILNRKIRSDSLSREYIKSKKTKIILLLLFMLLSITLGLIPHQPTINKDDQLIGVDTHYYIKWVNSLLHSKDTKQFLEQAFVIQYAGDEIYHYNGDRPVNLLFLFTIAKIVNTDISFTLERIPLILGPLLVLAVYFLTSELTSKNDTASLFASFFTAVSFQILIGIYAGSYANWFALIIGYFAFVFLFRYLKSSNKIDFVVYSILMILLLFSHIYTWTILSLVMGVFLLVMLFKRKSNYYRRNGLILLLLVVLSSVIIDVGRMAITGSASGIEQDIEKAHGGSGLERFAQRWDNLYFTALIYVGGQFSNFIYFMLALYWLFRSNLQEPSNVFLVVFLSIGIIPILFGNVVMQSRILYDIPFQIPAAIGLASYLRKHANRLIIWIPICIWLIGLSVRAVSNFYFVPTQS